LSRLRNFFAQLALEGNIRVLAVQTLISQLGFGMFYVIWQPYILSTGVRVVDLGVVQSVINLSTAAGLLIWGTMSDRFGRRPIILAAHACRLIAIVALLISGDFLFLLVFAFFMGFSSLFMQGNPARSALIAESVGDKSRATAFSVLMSISMIVNTVTASAGGWLAMTSGYTPIFYVCLVGEALGLLLMFAYLKETREPVEVEGDKSGGIWEGIKGLLIPEAGMGRLYAILLVMGFGYSTGFSLFYGTLVDNYGFTELQLGLLSTAFNLTWGLSSIPIGRMSDRFGRKPMLMASWAMAIISIVGFIFSRSFEMFLLFEVASGLDPSFWVPAWMSLISEKVPSERRSTVMGKIDATARVAGIPAPWLGGLLYSAYGFGAPLTVHLGCLMLSGLLIFTMRE
jgi:MFS family permease